MSPQRTLSPATRRKRTRMTLVGGGILFLSTAVALTLTALEENVTFFFGPTEVVEGKVPDGANFRIGGLVEIGSCKVRDDGVTREFVVTDGASRVTVQYAGILPSLFRDGQGVVARGSLDQSQIFIADEVLARHDETYMPVEAVEAMRRAGTWQGDGPVEGTSTEDYAGGAPIDALGETSGGLSASAVGNGGGAPCKA